MVDATAGPVRPGGPQSTFLEATMKAMKALLAAMIGASFLMLGGCNTIEGMGKDVKAGGAKVKGEAAEHKRY